MRGTLAPLLLLSLLMLAAAPAPQGEPWQAPAIKAALTDARSLPRYDACFHRYFAFPRALTESDLAAWSFHVNLLSDQGDLCRPAVVAPNLLRIDVRELGWDRRLDVLERFAGLDPYFHVRAKLLRDAVVEQVVTKGGFAKKGRGRQRNVFEMVRKKRGDTVNVGGIGTPPVELDELRRLLVTDAPVISGDFFLSRTARQFDLANNDNPRIGYYDWLGLVDRNAYFRLIGLDEQKAIALFKEWRALVVKSGVSQQNRQIVALNAITGRAWVTLDTFSETGRSIARRNLRRGEFAHDAEEWYGFLPNGLPATFLADKNGVRQAAAPDKIGGDDSPLRTGRDARIHVNLSCLRCHGGNDQLKPVDDWARKTFARRGAVLRLQDPDKRTLLELRRQYLSDIDRVLRRDREDFVDAIERATRINGRDGLTSAAITAAYGRYWNRYVEAPVTLDDAARELSVTPARLQAALKRYQRTRGGGDLVLDGYLDDPPQTLSRLEWEDSYQTAAAIAAGLQPPEQIRRVKANVDEAGK
jgi:hypothetical protein